MANRNYNGSFRNYGNQRTQFNMFQYDGPYSTNEINRARETFSYQFYNNSGRAMRSLKQKMYNSVNFYHQQQIESVIPSCFSVIQEEEEEDFTSNDVNRGHTSGKTVATVTKSQKIDIHTIEEDDELEYNRKDNLTINITNSSKTVNVSKTSSSTSVNSTTEPPAKKQRLSNETLTSVETTVVVDNNRNWQNESTEEALVVDSNRNLRNESTQEVLVVDSNRNWQNESTEEALVVDSNRNFRTESTQEVLVVDSNRNLQNGSTEEILDNTDKAASSKNTSNSCSNDVILVDSDPSDSILLSSDDDEEDEIEEEEETELCLMCDLCLHVVRDCTQASKYAMESHFRISKHNAASLIEAKIEGDKLIPRYVENKHCMSNNSITDCSILPVCPECNEIHGSVWTCAMHYQQYHNANVDNVYGLGKVVKRGVCQVSATPTCPTCNKTFRSNNKLHKHWKVTKHYPFEVPSWNQIMQFTCAECGRKEQSFITCRGHVLSKHATKKNKATTNMNYIYLELTPRLSLLPSKSAFFDQQIKENQKVVSKALQWVPLSNKKQSRRFRRSLIHKKNDYKRKTKTNIEKETYERFLNKHLNCNKFQYSQKS